VVAIGEYDGTPRFGVVGRMEFLHARPVRRRSTTRMLLPVFTAYAFGGPMTDGFRAGVGFNADFWAAFADDGDEEPKRRPSESNDGARACAGCAAPVGGEGAILVGAAAIVILGAVLVITLPNFEVYYQRSVPVPGRPAVESWQLSLGFSV
jgi:hypothetical protein